MINIFDLPTKAISVDDDEQSYGNAKAVNNPLSDQISQLLITFNLMYPEMTTEMETELTKILTELYEVHGFSLEKEKLDVSNIMATDYQLLEDLFNYITLKETGGTFTKTYSKDVKQ